MLGRFGRDIAIYGGIDLAFRLSQLLVIPIYAHVLSLKDFGLWSLLTVSSALLGICSSFGVHHSVVRFYYDAKDNSAERLTLVSTGLYLIVLYSLPITVAACALFAAWMPTASPDWSIGAWQIVIALAIVFPEQIAQYGIDNARLRFCHRDFLIISFVRNLLSVPLGLLFLLYFGMGLTGLLLAAFIASFLAAPLALLSMRREIGLRFDGKLGWSLTRFGTPFVLAAAAYWVFGSIDRWVLTALSTIEQVAILSFAFKLASVLVFLNSAFGQAWAPTAHKLRAEAADYRHTYSRILSLWFFVVTFFALSLSLFSAEAVTLLAPPAYQDAALCLSIAAAGLAFHSTTPITSLTISVANRTSLLSAAAWAAALLNLGLNLVLAETYGAAGSAFATLCSYAALALLLLFWAQRVHPLALERRYLGYSVVVALIATASAGASVLPINALLIAAKLLILAAVLGGAWRIGLLKVPKALGLTQTEPT